VLVTFPADRIILFVHPAGDERPHEYVDSTRSRRWPTPPLERHETANNAAPNSIVRRPEY
jgi:hypothetical protein